jgi:hypothetical protein
MTMTTRSEWNALAAKCKAATGPDREIDIRLAVAVSDVPAGYVRHDAFTWICKQKYGLPLTYSPATFTDSIDVIVALIERELAGAWWEAHSAFNGHYKERPNAVIGHYEDEWNAEAAADTPALALCAAFCRAKSETCEVRE